jgi:hypothetical protein
MHLIERYATSCGVKIGKPYVYETFFPLPVEKYITFHPFSKYSSKNYDYWQEVIDYILPYLNKEDIKIIQIGLKDDIKFRDTIHICGLTSVPQSAYIIRNSMMHLGADSFATHIASGMNKKIVALYSNNNINNVKPYWTKEEDMILFSSNMDNKPSYSAEELSKNINKIKPEEIAKAILKILNIKYNSIPETIYIGADYGQVSYEVIPDSELNVNNILIENPIIRMDYIFNEKFLENILQIKNAIIFTNKPIKKTLIEKYKSKVKQLIYIIDENNDPEFVKILRNNSINYILLSFLEEKILNTYKINYLDDNLIISKKYKTKEDFNKEYSNNLYYKSSRILLSSKGQHISRFDWIHNNKNKVIDDPDFWKEIDNFYIFKLT